MEDTAMDSGDLTMADSQITDSAMPDGAIMDPTMDDLFGEATAGLTADVLTADGLGVSLPPAPLPPGLVLRIAEMQSRGCCTKLAYSSTGSIAQITEDGSKVVFQALMRNDDTGIWSLSKQSNHPLLAAEGTIWEHIQFSGIGIELAALESSGAVYVYTLVGALGKMLLAPSNINWNESPRTDLDAVVGLHWLPTFPTEYKVPYISQAIKQGERWVTSMRHPSSTDLHFRHAVDNRNALITVSRDSKLTLMYQIEAVWHSVSTTLEIVTSSDELLSHAAMGEDGDHLLLIIHELSRRFRLYKISVNWNVSQQARAPGQPPIQIVSPTFDVTHLTMLDHVAAQHTDSARLSQLLIVPTIPTFAADPGVMTIPTVAAVFARAFLAADPMQQAQEAFSVISRWDVESAAPELHEAFNKLKSNGTTPTQASVTMLSRQEDIMTNKLILSATPQYFNTMIALSASDTTIEYRDRLTMANLEPYGDTTTVSSLPQAGFEQMMAEHSTHLSASPDGSALVYENPHGKLAYKSMSLRYTWHTADDEMSKGLHEAAVVCLARQHAILCCASATNDENLALLPLELGTEMRSRYIKEIIKMTNRVMDISLQDTNKQQQIAVREQIIPKALSAQLIIGRTPGIKGGEWASRYAFAFLNMKMVCTAITQLMSRPDTFLRTDILASMRGVVNWGNDLLVYVADSIINAKRETNSGSEQLAKDVFERSIEQKSCPAVHLLLNTFPRACLRFLASTLPKYLAAAAKMRGSAQSVTERQQLTEVLERAMSLPFKHRDFEALLSDFDNAVRDSFGQLTAQRRMEVDLASMCNLSIADELQQPLQSLLDTALPKFMETGDLGKLYFWDTSWLGIIPCKKARQYDIIRKLPLTKGVQLRVCRRCGSKMEDIPQEKLRELPAWLAYAQKHCICASYWILE